MNNGLLNLMGASEKDMQFVGTLENTPNIELSYDFSQLLLYRHNGKTEVYNVTGEKVECPVQSRIVNRVFIVGGLKNIADTVFDGTNRTCVMVEHSFDESDSCGAANAHFLDAYALPDAVPSAISA